MLREERSDSMPHDSMTREFAFTSMRWYYGGRNILALKLFRPANFDIPYAYCREKVPYVCLHHDLICSCKVGTLRKMDRARSLHWVLFDHQTHLVTWCELFDREKNFCQHVRAKGTTYVV